MDNQKCRELTEKEQVLYVLGDKHLPCPICSKIVKGEGIKKNLKHKCCITFFSTIENRSAVNERDKILIFWRRKEDGN